MIYLRTWEPIIKQQNVGQYTSRMDPTRVSTEVIERLLVSSFISPIHGT